MNSKLSQLYNILPAPMRSVAASLRGFYLRSWRYGSETEELIEEAIERESWNPNQWKTWQEERLSNILHRAAKQVPYYRDYWAHQRRHGNRASWEVLENWPILKKEFVRRNPLAFVAEDCNVKRMFCDHTSGTTGTPLLIYLKKNTVRQYYALFEARVRRWHGVSINERWAIMGGQQILPFQREKPPFWIYNLGLHQLYLSTFHLSDKNIGVYIDVLNRYNPTHMIVYPSSASILADAILREDLVVPDLKVIISNAEMLLDRHKEVISDAFRCPVRNTYGMGEIVATASECERSAMHIWPEVGVTEVLDDMQNLPLTKGQTGRFLSTGLLNADMPLIRYEVGDRGSLAFPENHCACGRKLPLLSSIQGRLNDLIKTPDGRRVFSLNPVWHDLPIKEAQIIQEELDCIVVRYVAGPDFTPRSAQLIIDRLHGRLGNVKVVLKQVNRIPREANGKFAAVKSHISS